MTHLTQAQLIGRMLYYAGRISEQNSAGALHIFIADGNCEDEHLEFCLGFDLPASERAFLEEVLRELTEEQRAGAWALAQCVDAPRPAEEP